MNKSLGLLRTWLLAMIISIGMISGMSVAQAAVTDPGVISGTIYNDVNDNSDYDPGIDYPVAGVVVQLLDSGKTEIAVATTNSDGVYEFAPRTSGGTYYIQVKTPPSGYQALPSTNPKYQKSIVLPSSTSISGGNALVIQGIGGSIQGNIFDDANINGILDGSEGNITGVIVQLKLTGSGTVLSSFTADGGSFIFKNLPASTGFTLEVDKTSIPMNYGFFTSSAGTSSSPKDAIVISSVTSALTNQNFALTKMNINGMSGTVFNDIVSDGAYVAGEDLPVEGATVKLYYSDGTTLVSGVTVSTNGAAGKTGTDGAYSFSPLPLGSYIVKLEALAGYDLKIASVSVVADSDVANYSNRNLAFTAKTSGSGAKGSITGYIFEDTNTSLPQGNNTPDSADERFGGVDVFLYKNGESTYFLKQKTQADGKYLFAGLDLGKYTVKMDSTNGVFNGFVFQDDTDSKFPGLTPAGETTKAPYEISDLEIKSGSMNLTQKNFWYVKAGEYGRGLISSYVVHIPGYNSSPDGSYRYNTVPALGLTLPITYEITELDGTVVWTFVTTNHGATAGYTWIPNNTLPVGRYLIRPISIPPGYTEWNYGTTNVKYLRMTGSGTSAYGTGRVSYEGNTTVGHDPENSGIKGQLFFDSNNNGIFDPGETPISAARMLLYDSSNRLLAVSATNTDGVYHFQRLAQGNYSIKVTMEYVKNGGDLVYLDDVDGGGADGVLNVDISSAVGLTDNQNIWFGPASGVTPFYAFGTVYMDTNDDGQITPPSSNDSLTDMKLRGATVELLDHLGNPVLDGSSQPIVTTTDVNGSYRFNDLAAGTTYQIRVSKAGYDALLSGDTQTVTMPLVSSFYESTDFLMAGKASIRGYSFIDYNGDGVYSAGEAASSEGFDIYDADYPTVAYGRLKYASTYYLNNLGPGTYRIVVRSTSIGVCYDDVDPSTPVGTIEVTIPAGDTTFYDNQNFTMTMPRSSVISPISGSVRLDTNNSGTLENSGGTTDDQLLKNSGMSVEVYRTAQLRDSGGVMTPLLTVPVDADGNYTIPSVKERGAGNFILRFVGVPAGYSILTDVDGDSSPSESILGAGAGNIQLDVRAVNSYLNQDVLLSRTPKTEISGRVFIDGYFDNTYDDGVDVGLAGQTVILKDSGGIEFARRQVNADGSYSFANLLDGTYTVELIANGIPANLYEAAQSASAAEIARRTVTISTGTPVYSDRNFWYQPKGMVGIAGRVAVDLNNNGTVESAEDFFLENVTVTLFNSSNVQVGSPVLTNAGGNFMFTGLTEAGNYTLQITEPSGYSTYAGVTLGVTVPESTMVVDQNFLLVGNSNSNPGAGAGSSASLTSGLSGFLYVGNNATPTGAVLSGPVTLTLYNSSGKKMATAKTDSVTGKYQFFNLAQGNYRVEMLTSSVPEGYGINGDVDGAPYGTLQVAVPQNATSTSASHNQNIWFVSVSVDGIQGKVLYDSNNNSAADTDDMKVTGITVELYEGATNTFISDTTTNAAGEYQFSNLPTMVNYKVKVKAADKTSRGYSDIDPSTGEYTVAMIPAGVSGKDFLLGGSYTLSGKVWKDADGDGTPETGVDSIPTTLVWAGEDGDLGTAADNIIFTSVTPTPAGQIAITSGTSAGGGLYSYPNLPAGTYRVSYTTTATDALGLALIPETSISGNTNPQTKTITTANATDVNFALQYSGSISGTVTVDVDYSKTATSVDTVLSGPTLTIRLEESGNSSNFKTVTTTDGTFSFTEIDPSKVWNVSVSSGMGTGYSFSFGEGDTVNTTVGNDYATVTLTIASPTKTGVVLGYKGNGKIKGKIVIDNNLTDGAQATSVDTPVGSAIKLLLSGGTGFVTREVTANSNGEFEISDLAPYTYTVTVKTAAADGFPTGLLTSFDPVNGMTNPSNIVQITMPDVMTDLLNQDFGYKGRGSISGKVLIDVEGTGTYTDADKPFGSAITVTATDGTNTRTTTADPITGEYSFATISSGTWEVYVATANIPTDYSFSYGVGEPEDSVELNGTRVKVSIDSSIGTRALTPTLNAFKVNLGYKGKAKISGRIVHDNVLVDGRIPTSVDTPVANHKVKLTGGTGFTPVEVTTNSNGEYVFENLAVYDSYQVEVATPTGYTFSFDPDSTETAPTPPTGDGKASYSITTVTEQKTNQDFGFKGRGAVSGKILIDVEGNGTYTSPDKPFGTAITVTATDGTITRTATANATTGEYSFDSLSTGVWEIYVDTPNIPASYSFSYGVGTPETAIELNGSRVKVDIDSALATRATTPVLKAVEVNLGYKGSAKIKGKVVIDNDLTDGRNATTADTAMTAGIVVTLTSTDTNFASRTVTTLADGSYVIENLAPYTYTVKIDQTTAPFPAGMLPSFDPDSTETAPTPPTANGSAVITIATPSEELTQKDFGYKGRGSIKGKILMDVEGAGTLSDADKPFGTAVTVTAVQGSTTRTTTSNAATGEYLFENIPTGAWEIYVDTPNVPTDYSFSYGSGPSDSIEVVGNKVRVHIDSALATRGTTPILKATEVHLGYKGKAKISGKIVYDNDDTDGKLPTGLDTPVANHKVKLIGGTGFIPVEVMTLADGSYTFTNLGEYDSYKIVISPPEGYTFSFDPDSTEIAPTPPTGIGEMEYDITSPTAEVIDQHFGFKGAGKIAGKIYIDLNDNGTFESAVDQPKSGITVTLTHATLPSRTATTDANGDYEVTGVAAGAWTATITGGTSGLRSPSFDYDDPYQSSGTPATPNTTAVNLTIGSPIADHVDFGFINRGKLEGVIKEDTYASGIYDAAAPGIAGVTVHLVENDGVTPKTYADGTPIVLITDENGIFTARNLDCPTSGSQYSVRVEFGPNTTGPLSLMEPSYDSDTSGTGCGSGVNLAAGTHVVNADLTDPLAMRAPTDLHLGYRASTGDIVIHKVAGKSTAKIGDIVPYTITIENMSDAPALNVTIEDLIPAGFKYVDGSTRLDGEKIEDPKGNRPLRFEEIDLGGASGAGTENSKRKLSYFLVVGSGVTQGEYTNSAIAKDQFNRNSSNVSQATVEITSDPLFDDSLIFGKVYIDANGNGEQDAEEEGLGGVKLATGRGEIITTDEHGRYHIPAVDGGRWERGRNFILKLDVRSLPKGYKVISDNPIVVRTSPGLPSKINFRVIEEKTQEAKTE